MISTCSCLYVLFGVLLAANGCPLDPISCTISYDDSGVVIIDAKQYCHVDNCTVKIINTGDERNITYHNDQYHLGCQLLYCSYQRSMITSTIIVNEKKMLNKVWFT